MDEKRFPIINVTDTGTTVEPMCLVYKTSSDEPGVIWWYCLESASLFEHDIHSLVPSGGQLKKIRLQKTLPLLALETPR